MSATPKRFQGQCEYCDTETEVINFPHLALNACDDCYRVHREAINDAERTASGE